MNTNKPDSRHRRRDLLYQYMSEQIRLKRNEGKEATADLYRATRNWLIKFTCNKELSFTDITPGFVDRFMQFLQQGKNLKTNTVNSYLSNFRAMYNKAVREGMVRKDIRPFAYLSLRTEQTTKRAVRKETMEEIASLDLQDQPDLELPADLCTFSYLACGIPFVDLVHLTRENIQGHEIVYQRIKTGTSIRIGITSGMRIILDKYARPDSVYLFPLLSSIERTNYEQYKTLLRTYNKALARIGERLKEPVRLTSYVIRHTWATEALRRHTPVAIISQALGHTSEKTTRFYLAQLDQSELNQANALIIGSVDNIMVRKRRLAG